MEVCCFQVLPREKATDGKHNVLERRSCGVSRLWLGSRGGCYGLNTIFTSSKTVLDDITWAVWRLLIYKYIYFAFIIEALVELNWEEWLPSAKPQCLHWHCQEQEIEKDSIFDGFALWCKLILCTITTSYLLSLTFLFFFFEWLWGETGSARGNKQKHKVPPLQSINPRPFFFLMWPQAPVIPPVPSTAERPGFIVAGLLHLQGHPQPLPPWAMSTSSTFLLSHCGVYSTEI